MADPLVLIERRAHRWRCWLLCIFQLPALALLLHAPGVGTWLAAVWGSASCILATDSDTPWLNRLLVLAALAWPVAAILR